MKGKRLYGVLKEEYFTAAKKILATPSEVFKGKRNLLLKIDIRIGDVIYLGGSLVNEEWVEIFEMSDPPTKAEIELMGMMGYRFKRGE